MEHTFGQQLRVKAIEKPFSGDPLENLDWICKSLGFMEQIDKNKVAVAIFRELLRAGAEGRPLTSAQLVTSVKMSRGSVVNHLNKLQRSGLIVKKGRYYAARSKSLYRIIEEIEADSKRIFENMKKTATGIDAELGINAAKKATNKFI